MNINTKPITTPLFRKTLACLAALCLPAVASSQSLEGLGNVSASLQSHRASSWDQTGGNADRLGSLAPGQTQVVLDTASAGCIRHIWMTVSQFPGHDTYLRDLVIRMYWEGSKVPCVEVPVGDFFGLGHAKTYAFQSLPVAVGENAAAMNCYWPMPFRKQARIELYNNGPRTIRTVYYHIDYESGPQDKRAGLFHAAYRRDANLCAQTDGDHNLSGKNNFVILETEGMGQYLGCFLYMDSQRGGWWGEGDDMIFIDHSEKPVINGTGSEDYFNNAWGFHGPFSYPFYGCPLLEKRADGGLFTTVYRWHVPDPVRFNRHIRVTLEHLWRPGISNNVSCVAYWYQTKPSQSRPVLAKGRANWPRAYPSAEPAAANFELNATELEEMLRAQGVKVAACVAGSSIRGWLQLEPGGQPVRIPVPVPLDGEYAVRVRLAQEGLEGEAKIGLAGQTTKALQSRSDLRTQFPWVELGKAHAVGKNVVLEVSGRALGLQTVKLARQP